MADQYMRMLNKSIVVPDRRRVPIGDYTGSLESRASRWRDAPAPPCPPSAFVLFHADCRESARTRGLLERSTGDALWEVVMRHVHFEAAADPCE